MNSSPLALFNGSYLGNRPTGIGVVARDLVNEPPSDLYPESFAKQAKDLAKRVNLKIKRLR